MSVTGTFSVSSMLLIKDLASLVSSSNEVTRAQSGNNTSNFVIAI